MNIDRIIPGMPAEFFAGFYLGLGLALSVAGVRYLLYWGKAVRNGISEIN